DVQLLRRRHVLLPHRVADLLDRRQGVRRDPHLEVVERRLQSIDVDDVVAETFGELAQRVDTLVENLLPVTHAPQLRVRFRIRKLHDLRTAIGTGDWKRRMETANGRTDWKGRSPFPIAVSIRLFQSLSPFAVSIRFSAPFSANHPAASYKSRDHLPARKNPRAPPPRRTAAPRKNDASAHSHRATTSRPRSIALPAAAAAARLRRAAANRRPRPENPDGPRSSRDRRCDPFPVSRHSRRIRRVDLRARTTRQTRNSPRRRPDRTAPGPVPPRRSRRTTPAPPRPLHRETPPWRRGFPEYDCDALW